MKYQEIMSVLSQSGLGALVMEADSRILAVNQAGMRCCMGREN